MVHEIQLRLTPREASAAEYYLPVVAQKLRVNPLSITEARIVRRSIDARQRQIWINLTFRVFTDEPPVAEVPDLVYTAVDGKKKAIIVGAGPSGLFAALKCIANNIRPVVLERGKPVGERKIDVAQLNRSHNVNPDSNYCYGEGGAGTFSDGKLYTRSVKRGNVRGILEILHAHGAPYDILCDAHPHIGTDKLPAVITNIRKTIEQAGGEVHFNTRVNGLIRLGNTITGVTTADGREFEGPVILATGHSARDVYAFLNKSGILLEPKTFAMGVRVEHPQHLIDQIQYHNPNGRGEYLPAAAYSFVAQVKERGVYSFCMCPGGFIVPSATSQEQVVVNGMSPANRNSVWANSGIVVEVSPDDVGATAKNPLAGIEYQQYIEELACVKAGSTQKAPAQRLYDFVNGRESSSLPKCSYVPGLTASPLHQWLPDDIGKRLREAFRVFGNKAPGYLTNDALIAGVESRTSSPVRIPRNPDSMQHTHLEGLYPCGEGAGYAGGIVSSAMDGEKAAEALAAKLK